MSVTPKIIYSYWEGDENVLINECFKQIKKLHSEKDGWIINFYNSQDLDNIFSSSLINKIEKVQYKADLLRLYLLSHKGGIWLDASCWCVKPVSSWVNMNKTNSIYGFNDYEYINDRYLETWAFSSDLNNIFMIEWYHEFLRAINMGFDEYKKQYPIHLKNHAIYNQMPYLTLNGAWLVTLQKIKNVNIIMHDIFGPFEGKYIIKFIQSQRKKILNPIIWFIFKKNIPLYTKFEKNKKYINILIYIIIILIIIVIFYYIVKKYNIKNIS